jgi:hypothetical protein
VTGAGTATILAINFEGDIRSNVLLAVGARRRVGFGWQAAVRC